MTTGLARFQNGRGWKRELAILRSPIYLREQNLPAAQS
jgi:hypothetical protein